MISTLHIVLAMKPLEGNFVQNALRYGVAGINIDGCRIGVVGEGPKACKAPGWDSINKSNMGQGYRCKEYQQGGANYIPNSSGRFPSNVILEGCSVKVLDEQSGMRPGFSGGGIRKKKSDIMPSIQVGKADANPVYHNDSGGASRFFKQVR